MKHRSFDEALIFFRNRLQLNQTDMAEKLGVSFRYYQKLESGHAKDPSVATLQKVLTGLNVSFEEFFSRPKPASRPPALRPQTHPTWQEFARLIRYYGERESDERLLGLYILSENPDYLKQYAAIDSEHAADAAALKQILATS